MAGLSRITNRQRLSLTITVLHVFWAVLVFLAHSDLTSPPPIAYKWDSGARQGSRDQARERE